MHTTQRTKLAHAFSHGLTCSQKRSQSQTLSQKKTWKKMNSGSTIFTFKNDVHNDWKRIAMNGQASINLLQATSQCHHQWSQSTDLIHAGPTNSTLPLNHYIETFCSHPLLLCFPFSFCLTSSICFAWIIIYITSAFCCCSNFVLMSGKATNTLESDSQIFYK